MSFFREKQQMLIWIAGTAMTGGFVLFRYVPLNERMCALRQSKAEQRLAIARATVQSETLPLLKEQVQQVQRRVENYENNVPNDRDMGVFLQRIANLMNQYNLEEQRIQPDEEIETGTLQCIPVSMQCKGKLVQVFEFYRRLQKLDRVVRIEGVKLENESDFSGEVSMETKAVIYYRPRKVESKTLRAEG